jgi:cyanophycinase
MGYILLEGGAEFGGRMADPDRQAIQLAGGLDASICIIPAAAAPDHNHQRAGQNGQRWFTSLGARNVQVLSLIDRSTAHQAEIISALQSARLVYLLGGFPGYLAESLSDTPAWEAILSAYRAGAVIAGSSAGAMVLCEYLYDPHAGGAVKGLGLLANACVLPHHNTFGKNWAVELQRLLPGVTLIGIDERTGMIDNGPDHAWQVFGQGGVTIYQDGGSLFYSSERYFHLPD